MLLKLTVPVSILLCLVQADMYRDYEEADPFFGSFFKNLFGMKKEKVYPEVPFAGSPNPLVNIGNVAKIKGFYYFNEIKKESGLGVYKLKMFEDRVILADPVAIHAIYNPKLVEKSKDFGLALINPLNLRGYLSSASTNGFEKARKKKGMWKILTRAERKYGNDGLYRIMKKHWESVLPLIKDNHTNVDNLIDVVTVRTLTEFFFDKPFDLSTTVFITWFVKGLTPKNKEPSLDAVGKEVTGQMYAYLDSTPWAKNVLPDLLRHDGRSKETLKSEALMFVFIFAAFGLKSGLSSTIPLYLNLDDNTKSIILKEVNAFHVGDKSMDNKLEDFEIMERFVTEVFRYLPPVMIVHARAKKDFTLDSLQGRYKVKKGTYLTGFPYGAQRDPSTFRLPNLFTTTGDESLIKESFFAFGGPYNRKPKVRNNKCLGQDISLNMAKMFVTLFAGCEIEAVSSLEFTESNPNRAIASDEPLRVNKFKC